MTITAATHPFTVSGFLFGEDQDTEQALAQALHEHGVLGPMSTTLELVSQAGREAAGNQVAVVADGLLDLDLGDLVVAGWRKQGQLAAAAERTAANPGSSEVVELATHRISSAHHPSVELLVNDVHVATVTFDLEVEFVVKALVVTVRDGHVVSLHAGACDVAATLAAEGIRLASRRAHFELPLVVRCYASAAAPTPYPTGPSPPDTGTGADPAPTVDQPRLASAAPSAPIGHVGRLNVGEVLQTSSTRRLTGLPEALALAVEHHSCLSYGDERTPHGEHLVSTSGCQPPRHDRNPR